MDVPGKFASTLNKGIVGFGLALTHEECHDYNDSGDDPS